MTHIQWTPRARRQGSGSFDKAQLAGCIQTCFECAHTCASCSDACLSAETVAELTKCIRTTLDCVDICLVTGKILARNAGYSAEIEHAVLRACRAVCKACADECTQHASLGRHCEMCTEACRRCEQACTDLLALLAD